MTRPDETLRRCRLRPGVVALGLCGLLLLGCSAEPTEPAAASVAVPDPDLSEMEPQVAERLQQARQALLAQQDSAEAWGDLGGLFDAHGLLDLAEVCYRRAVELAPDEFRWHYLLAVEREISGAELDEVRELFSRAAELRPEYAQIDLRLGDALSRRGEYEQARVHFERAVELAPTMATAHRGLGQVLLSLGEAESAVGPLTQATLLEPRDRTAFSSLAQAYMRLGESERAERIVAAAEGLEPVNAIEDPVWGEWVYERSLSSSRVFRRGQAKLRDADFKGAAEDFELVLQALPDNASAHFWLATAYRNLGDREQSLEHFSRATQIKPRMVKAWVNAGELLYSLGRYEEAEANFRSAIEVTPSDAGLHVALAEVLMRRGDLQALVDTYTTSAKLRPLGPREEANFAVALMRLGNAEASIEHYETSLRLRPDNPNTLYNQGLAFEMLGEEAKALERFKRAARLDPTSEAARHLAESHPGEF